MEQLLGRELCSFERTVEEECLKKLLKISETDIPQVFRARKQLNKAANEMETLRGKYQQAFRQQLQSVQNNTNKADNLRQELEEAKIRVEQAKVWTSLELIYFRGHLFWSSSKEH